MSDDEQRIPRFTIEPEPSDTELIAILFAMQRPVETKTEPEALSRWTEVARREQLHQPLDDRRTGWAR